MKPRALMSASLPMLSLHHYKYHSEFRKIRSQPTLFNWTTNSTSDNLRYVWATRPESCAATSSSIEGSRSVISYSAAYVLQTLASIPPPEMLNHRLRCLGQRDQVSLPWHLVLLLHWPLGLTPKLQREPWHQQFL